MKVDVAYFLNGPFNLKIGDDLECRARSQNANAWSNWSTLSSRYTLSDCKDNKSPNNSGSGSGSRTCKASCKATGCGGACNHQSGTFWSKLTKKACCKMGTCSGCKPENMDDQLHRHNYCHVHAEDKFRTRKRIIWTDK